MSGYIKSMKKILRHLLPDAQEVKSLQQHNQRLETFLHALPIEYCGWNNHDSQAISLGFLELIGLDKVDTIEDIAAILPNGDGQALEEKFDALFSGGDHFDMITTLKNGKDIRFVGAYGQVNGLKGRKSEAFAILWAQDLTEKAQEQGRQEEALEEAEATAKLYQNILDHLPTPVWQRNKDNRVIWANKTYRDALGNDQASQELPLSPLNKKDKSLAKNAAILADQARRSERRANQDFHMVMHGERRMLHVQEQVFDHKSGGMLGYAIDQTKVEELQAELAHLISANNEALEQLRTAVVIFDREKRLDFYNPAFEQLWDVDQPFLNAKPRMGEWLDKLREKRKLPEQADFKQFKENWSAWFTSLMGPHEEMLYLPDMTILRMVVVPRPSGGLLITFEDVTSRVELETSYNMLMDVQRETLDNLSEGLIVYGQDGKLKLWNPTFASLWDLQSADLDEKLHISDLIEKTQPFFNAEEWPEKSQELLNNGLGREARKGRMQRVDGTILEYSVVPLPDGNVLNTYVDITDTVKVEEALVEKNAALQEAEKLKSDFLANVSYQLRTPLNAMMGFAEIMNEQYFGELNDRQLGYTKSMIDAGNKLIALIDNILDLSTIEAGYMQMQPAEFKIKKAVEDVCNIAEEWARKQEINLTTKYAKSLDVMIADEQRFKQVLLNLISNAINFSDPETKIQVMVEKEPDYVVLKVMDHGIGLSDEDIAHVFQPFAHAKSKQNKRGGAGLGLALVKNIVEMHGGYIEMQSRKGKGTTVSCYFPMVPQCKMPEPEDAHSIISDGE